MTSSNPTPPLEEQASSTRMKEMLELAARVEALTGPDREVDAAIAKTIGWHPAGVDPRLVLGDAGWLYLLGAPAYSASLDSAMSLAPEGFENIDMRVVRQHDGSLRSRVLLLPARSLRDMPGDAATPALALTAACLKALAQQLGEESGG